MKADDAREAAERWADRCRRALPKPNRIDRPESRHLGLRAFIPGETGGGSDKFAPAGFLDIL